MRTVNSCPHRSDERVEAGTRTACCQLLQDISGLAEPLAVGRDACEACCLTPVPTTTRINPVIASLLSRLAHSVVDRGGLPGCDVSRAAALSTWARRYLRAEFVDGSPAALPPRATRPCLFLGEPAAPAGTPFGRNEAPAVSYRCNHPRHSVTTADACHRCRDWTDRPREPDPPIETLVPPPFSRSGPRVQTWAVGLTTAPRGLSTVDWSIDSLVRAGWELPHLFEDTPVLLASRSSRCPITTRSREVGAWPNYFLAFAELLMRQPDADAYLMAQDDALFYGRQDLRAYLEQVLWPGDRPGLVSLYCSAAYTQPAAGWHRQSGLWVWGAVAFIFPRELAKQFLIDPIVFEHRWLGPDHGRANIDGVIGKWAERHGISIHYPTPSLVQHIGDVSSIWVDERATGRRRADDFAEA